MGFKLYKMRDCVNVLADEIYRVNSLTCLNEIRNENSDNNLIYNIYNDFQTKHVIIDNRISKNPLTTSQYQKIQRYHSSVYDIIQNDV